MYSIVNLTVSTLITIIKEHTTVLPKLTSFYPGVTILKKNL